MQENIIKFLSAGVLVSVVTGIFSLTVSIINNRKIIQIEKNKQKFVFVQENYNEIKKVLDEMLHLDSILKDFPNNPSEITEESFVRLHISANDRFKLIQDKLAEISYMFSQENKLIIENEMAEIKKIDKKLFSFLDENNGLKPDPENTASKLIKYRINKVYNLNESFIDILKKQLEEIQKLKL